MCLNSRESLDCKYLTYGTWHGKLNFFRRRPREKSAYIRADNQRIPCGTISKFYSYNDISNDPCGVFLDPLALLRTKFAFWFPPFSNRIRTEDSCPSAWKIRTRPHGRSTSTRAEVPRRPRGSSAAPAWKFRGTRVENPRRSARNNHGIPRKKVKFSLSCTVNEERSAHNDNFMFSDTSALCALPRGLVCCYLLRMILG